MGQPSLGEILLCSHGYSAMIGIFLVALGAVMSEVAFTKYKKVEKQIDEDSCHHSTTLDALLTLAVLLT